MQWADNILDAAKTGARALTHRQIHARWPVSGIGARWPRGRKTRTGC